MITAAALHHRPTTPALHSKVNGEWVTSATGFEIGDSEATLAPDAARSNAFDYTRQIYAAYLQGARPIGRVQVQVGLRAETARRTFDLATPLPDGYDPGVDLDAAGEQTYQSLFPSAFATYSFGPGTLIKGAYSRRIERPRTFFLNPFPDLSNDRFVRVGNPSLRPEYTDSYELTFQYKFFATLTPFYRRTTDVISRRFIVNEETGINLFTAQNLDTQTSLGADVTLFGALGPLGSPSASPHSLLPPSACTCVLVVSLPHEILLASTATTTSPPPSYPP